MSTCKCGSEMKENARFCKSCGEQGLLDEKKSRVMAQKKSWVKPALIAALVVVVTAAGFLFMQFRTEGLDANPVYPPHRDPLARTAAAAPVHAQEGEIRIPLAGVDDGNAHFFSYPADGKTITFFVMKAGDGTIRTALDACIACNHAKLGYRQEGKQVVCNNCGMGFSPAQIGKQTGGCNPIPIQATTDGQMIVLKASELEAGARFF